MKATTENKEALQAIIDNLQAQIDVMYKDAEKTGHWTNEYSQREESLIAMISLIADERNQIDYELRREDDYGQAYLRSQI